MIKIFSPKSLGYDRSHIYSPDGRLYQVEYANEAVRKGSSCIALVGHDGLTIITQKNFDNQRVNFIPQSSLDKIFLIDSHVLLTGAGLLGDLQWLVSYARIQAQNLKLIYGEPAGILHLTKTLASMFLYHTQIAGYRPFGVTIILGGINYNKPVLYQVDPSGSYFARNACIIGEKSKEIAEFLEKEYSPNHSITDQLRLTLKCLKELFPNANGQYFEAVTINNLQPDQLNRLNSFQIDQILGEL